MAAIGGQYVHYCAILAQYRDEVLSYNYWQRTHFTRLKSPSRRTSCFSLISEHYLYTRCKIQSVLREMQLFYSILIEV